MFLKEDECVKHVNSAFNIVNLLGKSECILIVLHIVLAHREIGAKRRNQAKA